MMPPTPEVSAIVCLSPYFFGMLKSVSVHGSYPPIWNATMTKSAPSRASRRSECDETVAPTPSEATIFSATICASAKRPPSISISAMRASCSASHCNTSDTMFFMNTVEPAPIKVIFGFAGMVPLCASV